MIQSTPLVASPTPTEPVPQAPTGFMAWLANARSATFSLVLHTTVLIVLGRAVLYPSLDDPADFQADDTSLLTQPDVTPPPPETPPDLPEMGDTAEPDPGGSSGATMSMVTTASNVNSFKVNAPTDFIRVGNLINTQSILKGIGDGLGIGDGHGNGIGSGRGMGSRFGSKDPGRGGLLGRLYDLKQPKNGGGGDYVQTYRRFIQEGWKESILNDYYRSPTPLYATQIMIPMMDADEGPKAFNVEDKVKPQRWLVHYKGQVSPIESGTYHFVGAGDDVMVVRFNGKVVLDRSGWTGQPSPFFTADKNYHYQFSSGIPNGFAKGDGVTVSVGQWYEMEVLIGEQPGGKFFACLMMEKEGASYKKDGRGNPILPIFRLADVQMPEDGEFPPYAEGGPIWKSRAPKPN